MRLLSGQNTVEATSFKGLKLEKNSIEAVPLAKPAAS
jgi:hypothetical protein